MTPNRERTKGDNGYVYVVNDKYHRANGPALNFDDRDWSWWLHNRLHRYYGSAISKGEQWHLHGREIK
jgi:hypothetical protein